MVSVFTNGVPWDVLTDPKAQQNAQEIWDYFRSLGFTEESCAGIIGNMAQESYLNPGQVGHGYNVNDPYTPRGLLMWTTQTNIQNLYNYTGSIGWTDGISQCNYIYANPNNQVFSPNSSAGYTYAWGVNSGEYGALTDITEATTSFMYQAERPGQPHLDRRINFAIHFYEIFTGTVPPDPTIPPYPPIPDPPSPSTSNKRRGLPLYMMVRKLY